MAVGDDNGVGIGCRVTGGGTDRIDERAFQINLHIVPGLGGPGVSDRHRGDIASVCQVIGKCPILRIIRVLGQIGSRTSCQCSDVSADPAISQASDVGGGGVNAGITGGAGGTGCPEVELSGSCPCGRQGKVQRILIRCRFAVGPIPVLVHGITERVGDTRTDCQCVRSRRRLRGEDDFVLRTTDLVDGCRSDRPARPAERGNVGGRERPVLDSPVKVHNNAVNRSAIRVNDFRGGTDLRSARVGNDNQRLHQHPIGAVSKSHCQLTVENRCRVHVRGDRSRQCADRIDQYPFQRDGHVIADGATRIADRDRHIVESVADVVGECRILSVIRIPR